MRGSGANLPEGVVNAIEGLWDMSRTPTCAGAPFQYPHFQGIERSTCPRCAFLVKLRLARSSGVQISQKPVMANVGVADLQPQAITHTPKLRASHGSGLDKADSQAYPGPLVVPRGGGFSPTRGPCICVKPLRILNKRNRLLSAYDGGVALRENPMSCGNLSTTPP